MRDDGSPHYMRCIQAYRRIQAAAEAGRGVRLSAEEVDSIWGYDFAIQGAVDAADEEEHETWEGPVDGE